jgi:FkbM family methyltransferase
MKKVGSWYLPDDEVHFVTQLEAKGVDGYQVTNRKTMLDAYAKLDDYKTALAVDIGANVGFWTRDLCRVFDRVVAYEPVDFNIECLRENCVSEKLNIVGKALSNRKGTTTMWSTDGESGAPSMYKEHFNQANEFTVETRLLDDEVESWSEEERRNCFIKLDVQGHEQQVLEGGSTYLKEYGPAICIEFRANKEVTPRWIKWFKQRNYRLNAQFKKEHLFIPESRDNLRR